MTSLFMASTVTLLLISLWLNYKTLKTMAITLHFLVEFATSVEEEEYGETQRLH